MSLSTYSRVILSVKREFPRVCPVNETTLARMSRVVPASAGYILVILQIPKIRRFTVPPRHNIRKPSGNSVSSRVRFPVNKSKENGGARRWGSVRYASRKFPGIISANHRGGMRDRGKGVNEVQGKPRARLKIGNLRRRVPAAVSRCLGMRLLPMSRVRAWHPQPRLSHPPPSGSRGSTYSAPGEISRIEYPKRIAVKANKTRAEVPRIDRRLAVAPISARSRRNGREERLENLGFSFVSSNVI